jgi:serine protease
MLSRKLLTVAVIVLAACLVATSPNSSDLKPRHIPVKPVKSTIPAGYDDRHVEVKFADDLDIGLSTRGRPFDRSTGTLESSNAIDILTSIMDAGGIWVRMTGNGEEKADLMREIAQGNLNRAIADLNNYFILTVPKGQKAESWMDRLNSLWEVEIAHPLPLPMPPPVPDYESQQGYLNPATDGIDAKYAWTLPGGTGNYVTICDLEYSWNLSHDDLPAGIATWIMTGYTPQDPFNDDNHGTAVLGELVSQNNGWGTTGASYGSFIAVAPTFLKPLVGDSGWFLGVAMTNAMYNLAGGDVMLIEHQMAGPNWSQTTGDTGLVPIEWYESWYNTVVTIVGNGIYVVECAGNGYQDLDDPVYNTGHAPFVPQNHSGAIIVGAGGAPASFGGTVGDRSRMSFSNYGRRVDLQGWGEVVTTTGYGYLYSAEGVNRYYTGTFNGTSSAAPNVAAAVALVSSVNEAYNTWLNLISPGDMLHLLRLTGSPQQSGTHPPWEIIGPRPNVKAAINISGIADTLYFKPGYVDYCPSGIPDFSMHLDSNWMGYTRWTYDAPVALANCFWWFDSKFEPSPVDPRPFYPGNTGTNDNYPLVTSYGVWDDHDTSNVKPLIEAMASCMGTDDTTTGAPGFYEYGTHIFEMEGCIETWLTSAGLRDSFADTVVDRPDFDYLAEELHRSQNIILLLGLYGANTGDPDDCCRIGGHYVNMVGVDSVDRKIGICDPFYAYATGLDQRNPGRQNDASDVFHEVYQLADVSAGTCALMAGALELTDYPDWMYMNFESLNGGFMCYPGYPQTFFAVIEYAIVICPTVEPQFDTCAYYKESYIDYAPNGVPDFDQKQAGWISPYTGGYSWCGPVALANCAWWFDSKFEPNPIDPRPFYPPIHMPGTSDGHALVQSYAPTAEWDDHDTNNVCPFIVDLKSLCTTDGPVPGTVIGDLRAGFDSLAKAAGLDTFYTSTLVPGPGYELIRDSVLASRNVILLFGFYEPGHSAGCARIGGHYVTCAGVCTTSTDVCVSDPYFDKNENEPPAGSSHGPTVHNDAYYVSGPHDTHHHDRYHLESYSHSCNTPAVARVTDYPGTWSDLINFDQQNWFDLSAPTTPYEGGPIVVMVDYALVISPSCWCDVGDANNDGALNILDATYIINYLYKNGPAPYHDCLADANCDCTINILDATEIINYLYKNGSPPCSCEQWVAGCGPLGK